MFASQRRTHRRPSLLESLEARQLLDASLPYEIVLPEGWASDAISQVVPIGNPNAVSASYRLTARYERNWPEQIIAQGTLAAETRATIPISNPGSPLSTLVRKDEPYALVLESDQPLAASLDHQDFGTAVSVPFTPDRSTQWAFAEVRRESGENHDFILVYNPGVSAVVVALTFHDASGVVLSVSQPVEPLRRGGWAVDDIPGLPDGVYGVKLSGTGSVVASLSSYGILTRKSYATLGTSGGGTLSGVVPATDIERRYSDEDSGGAPVAPSRHAVVSLLNTTASIATVTLSFVADLDTVAPETRTVQVDPGARLGVDIGTLGLPADFEYGLAYASDAPISVFISAGEGVAGGGTSFASSASATWDFATGGMDQTRAGQGLVESVALYNPQTAALDINVDLMFDDGLVFSLSLLLDSRRTASIPLHLISDLVQRAPTQSYLIRVSSLQPMVAAPRRWDDALAGGYLSLGIAASSTISLNGMTP